MRGRKIEIYVDFEFLEKYFEKLRSVPTLSEEFEVFYSFFKIIQQSHVKLIRLDTGIEIKAQDIVRVYHSNTKPDHRIFVNERKSFHFHSEYDFSSIKNPQSVFFSELLSEKADDLGKKHGFAFSDINNFPNNWSRLLLIGKKNTIHVKTGFTWAGLKTIAIPCNSIILIEPFIMGWLQYKNKTSEKWVAIKSKIEDNVIEAVRALTDNLIKPASLSLKIITRSDKELKGDQGDSQNNIKLLSDKLCHIASVSIKSFKNGELKTHRDKFKKESMDLQNLLHDRYLITNYHLIVSTHSLDLVDRDKDKKIIIKKNTQLIILPLLQCDYFNFYESKMDDYKNILNWKDDPQLKQYLLSEPQATPSLVNKHFN